MTNTPLLHPNTAGQIEKGIENLPHALILHGEAGSGVSFVAQYVATKVAKNIQTITPKKRNGAQLVEDYENGAIVIEDIRRLYEQTRSKFTSPQIFIIDCKNQSMTHAAQNAFLKLLEEPQNNVHFIIATHHLEQLLPTILSRCQRISIQSITKVQTEQLLDELRVTDPTKRARLIFIASGKPAEIQYLATDEAYYERRVQTVQDAKAALESSPYNKLLIIRKYKDQRPLTLQLIDDMLLQLQMTLTRSQEKRILRQIDALITASDKIRANGNIQLQLTRVLL